MKQTTDEMIDAILAFQKDGKVEWSLDGKEWSVIYEPSWDFYRVFFRPVQKPVTVKYLCYEHRQGLLRWLREDGLDQKYYADNEDHVRVPELDREVTR